MTHSESTGAGWSFLLKEKVLLYVTARMGGYFSLQEVSITLRIQSDFPDHFRNDSWWAYKNSVKA